MLITKQLYKELFKYFYQLYIIKRISTNYVNSIYFYTHEKKGFLY